MNNKAKKFVTFAAPAILTLPIVFCASLAGCSKKFDDSKKDEPAHTHTFVYADESATQHKKTCSGCTEINELADHVYDDDYDETCNDCTHTRIAPKYSAASRVAISADKTKLTAGDEFTLTVEIETQRADLTWRAITMDIGPLVESSSENLQFEYSVDLSKNFEYVDHTTNLKVVRSRWADNTCGLFEKDGYGFFRISLAYVGTTMTAVNSSEKIVVSAKLKVKETATFTGALTFGVMESDSNNVWFWNSDKRYIADRVSGTSYFEKGAEETEIKGLSANSITLNISDK